ncbi:unnamed protein product [Rotaria sp. Silwood1]|nr:unnamed protein product [Rotaria sp. Silwood1]
MTSVEASEEYGVPQSTIRNNKRRPLMSIGSGRPYLLQQADEDQLAQLLLDLEQTGLRLTKSKVMDIVKEYVGALKEKPRLPGRFWFHGFLRRQKDKIKFIKEQKLERSRKEGFTETVRTGWFDTISIIMEQNQLFDKPGQIYNLDECGFNDDTQRELVLASAETKIKYEENGGTGKSFTTILICVNAKGDVLPPMTIYGSKTVNKQWTVGGPDRSVYKCSSRGWINEDLFSNWFIENFLVETKSTPRPLLLVLDGHHCHFSVKVIEAAKQNEVIIVCLPPHSTHGLQPLDLVTASSSSDHDVLISSTSMSIVPESTHADLLSNDFSANHVTSSGFPRPTTIEQAIQLIDSVLSNNDTKSADNNKMDVLQSMEYNLEPHLTFSYSPSHGTNNLFFNGECYCY